MRSHEQGDVGAMSLKEFVARLEAEEIHPGVSGACVILRPLDCRYDIHRAPLSARRARLRNLPLNSLTLDRSSR